MQSERELIYLLLHSKSMVADFLDSNLTIEHFDKNHSFILDCIVDCFDVGVILTRETFCEKSKSLKSAKDRISNEMIFNSCSIAKAKEDNFPTLVNKLLDYNIEKSINTALKHFGKQVDDNKLKAVGDLSDDLHNILAGNASISEKIFYEDITSLTEKNIQYIEDVRSGKIVEPPPILTGIREIDDTMVVGLKDGTLHLFCADVGHFKSTIMMNIGLNVWEAGNNVLFVPLEMDKDQIWERIYSRESGVKNELITKNRKDLSDDLVAKLKEVKCKHSKRDARFFVMQEPRRTDVISIQRQIERNIKNFSPKLVIIDYVANLEPHIKRTDRNDLEIGDMLKTMRHMGKTLGFSVISGAQLGRPALLKIRKAGANRDKVTLGSEDIRGSHEYSADADTIYAQIKSTSQPNQLLDLFCIKSRGGATVFKSGDTRATLEVYPETYLIRSQGQSGFDDLPIKDIILDNVDKLEHDDDDNFDKIVKAAAEEGSHDSSFEDEEWF